MEPLERDVIFVALTRPQMLGGVTYSYAILNIMMTTELFILFNTLWVLLAALAFHAVGWAACQREPRIFEMWRIKIMLCPRNAAWRIWGCNGYRP